MNNDEYLKHIGIELKIGRVRKNLSRRQLAVKTKLSENAIFKIETGRVDGHLTTIKRLCDVLDLQMRDFV